MLGLAMATPVSCFTHSAMTWAPAGHLHLPHSTAAAQHPLPSLLPASALSARSSRNNAPRLISPRTAGAATRCSPDNNSGVQHKEHVQEAVLVAALVSVGFAAGAALRGFVRPLLRQLVRKLATMVSVVVVALQGVLGLGDVMRVDLEASPSNSASSEVSAVVQEPLQGARKSIAQGISVVSASALFGLGIVFYRNNERTSRRPKFPEEEEAERKRKDRRGK